MTRSSLDKFECMGEGKERLAKALELVLHSEKMRVWRVSKGVMQLAQHRPADHTPGQVLWVELLPGLGASAIAELVYPFLCSEAATNSGPDGGGCKKGWRVLYIRDVIEVMPYYLYWAK